jgi:hypothetical protein
MRARILGVMVGAALFTGCLGADGDGSVGTAEESITTGPQVVPGNPSCASLGLGTVAVRFDPPLSGSMALGGSESVTIAADGIHVDWSATIGIDAVIVKGGPNANIYGYAPESLGATQLQAPTNPNNGKPYGLSHVDFCYDWDVKVAKTATTSFTRSRFWSIEKSGSLASVTLDVGAAADVTYTVTTAVTGSVDSAWAVAGTITVENPAPHAATLLSIADDFDGNSLAVTCGVPFPHVLPAGASLVCSYQAALGGPVNGTNVATVATTGPVGPGSASAPVDFAAAAITVVDDCIDVVDDHVGALGTVCSAEAPRSFSYVLSVGPYSECGPRTFDNTASYTAHDSAATGSDSWTVAVDVTCDLGCTLTPGYWKNHQSDPTWALLPQGTQTAFFLSAKSYLTVLGTPPQGNAYYILGKAYAAAHLNKLAGASFTAAATAFAQATTLLQSHTPAQAPSNGPAKAQWTSLASVLDGYNNGDIGPGHCP